MTETRYLYVIHYRPRPRAHARKIERWYMTQAAAEKDAKQLLDREYPGAKLLYVCRAWVFNADGEALCLVEPTSVQVPDREKQAHRAIWEMA